MNLLAVLFSVSYAKCNTQPEFNSMFKYGNYHKNDIKSGHRKIHITINFE
jgi:hypothetical protein